MTLMQQILLMNAEIRRGNVRLTRCQQLNAGPGNGVHKDGGEINLEQKSQWQILHPYLST